MDAKYSHLSLQKIEENAELEGILFKMDNLCEQYLSAERKRDFLNPLHSLFWQSVMAMSVPFLKEENKESFALPPEVSEWINLGAVSPLLSEAYADNCATLQEKLPDDVQVYSEYQVYYLTDWIAEFHKKNIRLEYSLKIRNEVKAAQDALSKFPQMLKQYTDQRQRFLEKYPAAQEVVKISKRIDEKLNEYNDIQDKIQNARLITGKERERFVQLTEELNNLREVRAKEQIRASGKVPQQQLMSLDRAVENVIGRKKLLEKRLARAEEKYKSDISFRQNLPISKCKELLKDEIRRIRNMADLIGKRARLKQTSVMSGRAPLATRKAIIDEIENVLEIDSSLVDSGTISKKEFPVIIIIPAIGNGVYDFEANALLIPTRPIKELSQAVVTALVEYHLDSPKGARFKDSYRKLAKNKMLTSTIALRENLIKDYLDWITMEAKGYQVLDADTRRWFIENVAPAMFALRHPRRLGNMQASEAQEAIQQCEDLLRDEPDSYKLNFKLGMACWRVGSFAKANHSFVKAAEADPDSLDAVYNAALSCFKTGQKKKAGDLWKRYLSLDKASFWTLRVQKFLSAMR